jgi:thiol-disulfide isomerase/thioredoxin
MKKILIAFSITTATLSGMAQQQYESTTEAGGTKILKGIISKNIIAADTSFSWYAQNKSSFTPNAEAVSALKTNTDKIQFIVFGGTWCSDTQNLLPKFFSYLNAAGYSADKITLIGVDRNKKAWGNMSETMNIKNVPTFIVMKDGKEVGRVVEYGKYGQPDKEIGEIIKAAQ